MESLFINLYSQYSHWMTTSCTNNNNKNSRTLLHKKMIECFWHIPFSCLEGVKKILNKVTEICAKIQQAIGPHEDLLAIGRRRKLQWYGHVSRSSGQAKTILQGTVKGVRPSRLRDRWGEVRWGEVRWGEVRWDEVRWGEQWQGLTTLQSKYAYTSWSLSIFPLRWGVRGIMESGGGGRRGERSKQA